MQNVQNNKLLAYLLIGIGALFLLSRISIGSDWIWIAVVSVAFLWAYSSRKRYGFLVTGSVLAGVSVGALIDTWAGFMISLAVGFLMIDRIEPRSNRWPMTVAGILAGIGILGWLLDSGVAGSLGFSVLLIAAGAYLLTRRNQKEVTEGSSDTFVTVAPQPTEKAAQPSTDPAPVATSTTAKETTTVASTPSPNKPSEVVSEALGEKETDGALYTRLETWRRETAQSEDRAAYLILTNASLEQIAQDKPQTLEELRAIKGIGPVKLERYGEAILALMKNT